MTMMVSLGKGVHFSRLFRNKLKQSTSSKTLGTTSETRQGATKSLEKPAQSKKKKKKIQHTPKPSLQILCTSLEAIACNRSRERRGENGGVPRTRRFCTILRGAQRYFVCSAGQILPRAFGGKTTLARCTTGLLSFAVRFYSHPSI